jgi:ubiquinone/menaquinone biosynthesis C-methylase UbiE
MLLRGRATQPEHFDDPQRTAEEFRVAYQELARVNKLFRLEDPYTRVMSQWLGAEQCRELSILDLGAGDGWLGRAMEAWARDRGWQWQVTDLDVNPVPLSLSRGHCRIAASALALPFEPNAFDIVIASQMTHHFNSDEDVIAHFSEAWRVAKRGVFITDMRRGWLLYTVLLLTLPLLRLGKNMRADGLLSVRKSWKPAEFRSLAQRAGIKSAKVSGYYGARVILAAEKSAAPVPATETSEAYRGADGFYSAPSGR